MTRVKRGYVATRRRKKLLTFTKGYRGASNNLFRIANQQVMKALKYGYVDRRDRKRQFRNLWIQRINAAVRSYGKECFHTRTYSRFIAKLKEARILLNRKVLSQLSILDPASFKEVLFRTVLLSYLMKLSRS